MIYDRKSDSTGFSKKQRFFDKDTTKNDKVDYEKDFENPGSLIEEFRQSGSQIDWTLVTRILTSGSYSKIIISGSYAFKAQTIDSLDPFAINTMKVYVKVHFYPLMYLELPQKNTI